MEFNIYKAARARVCPIRAAEYQVLLKKFMEWLSIQRKSGAGMSPDVESFIAGYNRAMEDIKNKVV